MNRVDSILELSWFGVEPIVSFWGEKRLGRVALSPSLDQAALHAQLARPRYPVGTRKRRETTTSNAVAEACFARRNLTEPVPPAGVAAGLAIQFILLLILSAAYWQVLACLTESCDRLGGKAQWAVPLANWIQQ
jgi:hypothetical protein